MAGSVLLTPDARAEADLAGQRWFISLSRPGAPGYIGIVLTSVLRIRRFLSSTNPSTSAFVTVFDYQHTKASTTTFSPATWNEIPEHSCAFLPAIAAKKFTIKLSYLWRFAGSGTAAQERRYKHYLQFIVKHLLFTGSHLGPSRFSLATCFLTAIKCESAN